MFVYTASADSGIQVAAFDQESGTISGTRLAAEANCLFLAAHPSKRVIYGVNAKHRLVLAYSVQEDGGLVLLSKQDAGSEVPCHLVIDSSGSYLVVANYNGGVALFELGEEGEVSELRDHWQPVGSGPHKRQEKPHPHGVTLGPDESRLYVADLGTDRIQGLEVNRSSWKLVALEEQPGDSAQITPGAGPRHLEFTPDGKLAIVVNELANTLTVLSYDQESRKFGQGSDYTMLPEGWEGVTWAAEISIHPSGQTCYASNRGQHSVVVYPVNSETLSLGKPTWIQDGGTDPQHHLVDTTGRWLLVAYRTADEVAVYPLDAQSGKVLGGRVNTYAVSKPMCVLLVNP